MPEPIAAKIVSALHAWYNKNKRALPFRLNKNPYSVWVSEIMLQQTRVAAMLPRYAAFIDRFPDVKSLAESSETDVLKAWQGLGYYSRARNLRLAAQKIVESHNGIFPKDRQSLKQLPGIGDYTSAALMSICFDQPVAVIDGNVKRVISRLFCDAIPLSDAQLQIRNKADSLMQNCRDPSTHNQAMMEIGALVCTPGVPLCAECPLKNCCQANARGGPAHASAIPPRKKEQRMDLLIDYFALRTSGGYLLCLDPSARFLANQWMLPHRHSYPERDLFTSDGLNTIASEKQLDDAEICGVTRHTITHHRITARLRTIKTNVPMGKVTSKIRPGRAEWKAVPENELAGELVSSLGQKLIRLLKP